MFGLLELSRQRLRSSFIERSFDKCHYCNGSGIISNINLISEQIIKVIQEKLIISKSAKVLVKCNSALAQTLINIKREEINKLEEIHNAKIEFSFDNHFSLHEPLIEVDEKGKGINIKKDISKKSKNKIKIEKTKKKQISLHEPLIEIDEKDKGLNIKKNTIKKSKNKIKNENTKKKQIKETKKRKK